MRKVMGVGIWIGVLATGLLAVENRAPLGEPPQGSDTEISSGTMNVEGVSGCFILVTGTVTTFPVGGTVDGAVNFWDDGNFIAGYTFNVEGDGGTYNYCVVHQVLVPILQGAAGIGVYLEDEVGLAATTTFVSNGAFNDVTEVCTGSAPICGGGILAVPTLDRTGLIAFAGLLALAAIVWVARRRQAAPRS